LAKIYLLVGILLFGLSCASNNMEWRRPTMNMAQTWKEYYQKCLDENPDNEEKCRELKKTYEAELESTRQMGRDPETGQEPYY